MKNLEIDRAEMVTKPLTKESAPKRLKDFAEVIGLIFQGKESMDEALKLMSTIAGQRILFLSKDGQDCIFLNHDQTIGGNLSITPNEISLTTAHRPGLDLIAVYQVKSVTTAAAGIRIIPTDKPVIEYFSDEPSAADPQSALLAMFNNSQTT